ncbi:MAG: ABC transporter ATP-binding protein [Anaerovoracaceae bacterium]|nr:ABC transporter ATP-binding protein [Bacillota bacterium]MDY5905363.1 ABC transporter ATP-binding protein [Anaerovoracaceae bacterium]
MERNELIELKGIVKRFDDETILKSLDLSIKDGEFVTLLGPSGCGKTTTLRIIAGFETPDEGEVLFAGKNINKVPPNKRNINTVFQRYALFPHLNVKDNIAFGLKLRKTPQSEIDRKVEEMLELVNLKGFGSRSTASLSGGQQQRVAIARAIVNEPKVLLLDEPLGALDLKLRKEMQIELKKLHERLDMTFLYVTHDQEEALTMSDTVVVMNHGEILQKGTPIDIYNEPANAFVADFIGESNIIPGIMKQDKIIEFLGTVYDCVDTGFDKNENVDVVIRPEDIVLLEEGEASIQQPANLLKGRILSCLFKGVHYEMLIDVPDGKGRSFTFMAHSTIAENIGAEMYLDVDPDNIHIMKKSSIETMTAMEYRLEHDPTALEEAEEDEE